MALPVDSLLFALSAAGSSIGQNGRDLFELPPGSNFWAGDVYDYRDNWRLTWWDFDARADTANWDTEILQPEERWRFQMQDPDGNRFEFSWRGGLKGEGGSIVNIGHVPDASSTRAGSIGLLFVQTFAAYSPPNEDQIVICEDAADTVAIRSDVRLGRTYIIRNNTADKITVTTIGTALIEKQIELDVKKSSAVRLVFDGSNYWRI